MGQTLKVAIVGDASSYARALNKASGETTSFGKTLGTLGKYAALGLGAAGVGGALLTLKRGFDEIKESQKVMAQTGAVLQSTGEAANVTAKHVGDLATQLSLMSGADDEAVQSGENMLLTFTNIRNEVGKNNDIFDQATKATLDMATAMNSGAIPSSEQLAKQSILVGKALNDPVKGMAALRRVGVSFTQGQIETIKALVKSGKTMEAQKLILHELNKEFGGSAAAAGKTLPGQLNKLKNAFDELAGGIVSGLAPVLSGALGALTRFVQKLGAVHGLKAKVVVAAQFVWSGLTSAVSALQKEFSDLLFGSFQKGGGVGPEGIKFSPGLVAQFSGALAALDWTETGKAIMSSIADALSKAGNIAKPLAARINEAIQNVDWVAAGRALGPGFLAMIATAFNALFDPVFWAKNWDLALSVLLARFGGGLGKIGLRMGELLTTEFAAMFGRISPRLGELTKILGEAILKGLAAIPGLVGRALGPLEALVRGIFGRLGGLAVFAIKVLGIDVAIHAVADFASHVAGFFTRLAGTVGSALDTAWEAIKRGALTAALAIIEPFSHLPFGLGSWAQKAKVAIQTQLDNIDLRAAAKHVEAWGADLKLAATSAGGKAAEGLQSTVPKMKAAGTAVGAAGAQGVAQGIYAWLPQSVAAGVALVDQTITAMRTAAAAKSPSKKTIELGKDMVKGLGEGLALLGPTLARQLIGALSKSLVDVKTVAVKGMGNAAAAIVAAAKKAGVDARAALAVAMTEGGTSFGKTGDSGTSFGPFQLHIGGASPFSDPKKAAEFANSIKGITYALEAMAKAGAAGKTGFDAIKAIVTSFERPANPSAEIAKAISYYKEIPKQLGGALEEGGKQTASAIVKTLQGLAELVKTYGPQIGADHVRGIIAGLVGKTADIVAAAKAQMEKVVAAMAAATQARADVKTAFKQLATDALAAFDAVTDAWHPHVLDVLAGLRAEDTADALQKSVDDASQAVKDARAKLLADQAAGPQPGELPADYQKRIDEDNAAITAAVLAQGAATRAQLEGNMELQAAEEQKQWEERRGRIRTALQLDLVAIGEELDKQPKAFAANQQKIIRTLAKYNIPMQKAGKALAEMFGGGLGDGLDVVIAALHKLTAALDDVKSTLGVGKSSGGGGVNPNTYGERGGGVSTAGGTSSGRGTSAMVVNVTVNGDVTGEEIVKKVRTGLQKIGRDNAINPLAV